MRAAMAAQATTRRGPPQASQVKTSSPNVLSSSWAYGTGEGALPLRADPPPAAARAGEAVDVPLPLLATRQRFQRPRRAQRPPLARQRPRAAQRHGALARLRAAAADPRGRAPAHQRLRAPGAEKAWWREAGEQEEEGGEAVEAEKDARREVEVEVAGRRGGEAAHWVVVLPQALDAVTSLGHPDPWWYPDGMSLNSSTEGSRRAPCRAKAVAFFLAPLTCIPPTPMRSSTCTRLPSVEQCLGVSWSITDDCLRKCVQAQCKGATVKCGDAYTELKCIPKGNGRVGGFVPPRGQTCSIPWDEVNWCDLPLSSHCRARAMVHELAHTCGWHHKDGHGVPGDHGEDSCF